MAEIIETQYLPTIEWFKIVKHDTSVKIDASEHFKKMSFRNRAVIAGANGLITLSVPIQGGREKKKLMKEVEVDVVSNWRLTHIRAIESSYRKAPFYDYYADQLNDLINRNEKSLLYLNLIIIEQLCKWLKMTTPSTISDVSPNHTTNFRDTILPKNFQDAVDWQPKYSQLFEQKIGFQPNLSILDLLFNEGPNATYLLEATTNK